jgi:hypothetical protein
MVEPSFKKHGFINIRLLQDWKAIVGDDMAKICWPTKIAFNPGQKQGGVLHLSINNPAFSLAVSTQQNRIIDKISTYFGYKAVSRLRIAVASASHKEHEVTSQSFSPTTLQTVDEDNKGVIPQRLQDIQDEEIKELLCSIYLSL